MSKYDNNITNSMYNKTYIKLIQALCLLQSFFINDTIDTISEINKIEGIKKKGGFDYISFMKNKRFCICKWGHID